MKSLPVRTSRAANLGTAALILASRTEGPRPFCPVIEGSIARSSPASTSATKASCRRPGTTNESPASVSTSAGSRLNAGKNRYSSRKMSRHATLASSGSGVAPRSGIHAFNRESVTRTRNSTEGSTCHSAYKVFLRTTDSRWNDVRSVGRGIPATVRSSKAIVQR